MFFIKIILLYESIMDQYKGFEPSPTEWKSVMLPLHQYWILRLEGRRTIRCTNPANDGFLCLSFDLSGLLPQK